MLPSACSPSSIVDVDRLPTMSVSQIHDGTQSGAGDPQSVGSTQIHALARANIKEWLGLLKATARKIFLRLVNRVLAPLAFTHLARSTTLTLGWPRLLLPGDSGEAERAFRREAEHDAQSR